MVCRSLLPSVASFLVLFAGTNLRAEPPAEQSPQAAAKQFVTVEVTVLEVNRTKLRAVGFDWDLVATGGKPSPERAVPMSFQFATGKQLDGFLQALKQYDLAKVISQPKLMTLSGRPASLAVGPTKLEVVPVILGTGRVSVEHRLEVPHAGGVLRSHSAVEVEPGQSVVVGNLRSEKKDAAGKVSEMETLVLVRATTGNPDEQATAAVPARR